MRKQHDYTECYERPCDPCDRAAHSLTDEEYVAATADAEQKQEPLTRNILVGLSMSKQTRLQSHRGFYGASTAKPETVYKKPS